MTPHNKGWLKEYLRFRQELLLSLINDKGKQSAHPEYSLYKVIQPTGLMYGQSVGEVNLPQYDSWSEKDRMKVLLAESLISSSLLFYGKPIRTPEALEEVITKTLESIGNFYNNIFPELATPTKTLFGKKKSAIELAEKILDKRIEHASIVQGNFWASFFHNSLLFLDVYIFGQWIHTNADKIVSDFFRYEREELRFSIVKVIAAAAHANKEVAYEEKKLFGFFIDTTQLSSERRKQALHIFEEGIAIEDINLPSENSWILRKFFLELAILTIWADKKVEQEELDFLKRFSHYFDFSEDDLENSMIAIEGFVLEHWHQLERLQKRQEYQVVSDLFIRRIARVAEKNQTLLLKEIKKNEDVVNLLKRARSNELTLEEKEHVRHALIQILKTIPTFSITALPQNFLTLPIILKILPQKLFAEGIKS